MRTSQKNNHERERGHGPAPFAAYMKEKLAAAVIIVALALFALVGKIYQIQRDNSEDYNKIVLSQRQSEYVSQTIPYKRGDIYDRNGNRLAYSEKVYNLILDPRQMVASEGDTSNGQAANYDVVDTTVDAIAEYFGDDRAEVLAAVEARPNSSYVRYKREISYDDRQGFLAYCDQKEEEFAQSEDANVRKKRIRGVWFEDEYKRKYPYNSLACNVVGFASADGTTGTGGVEQYYNDTLTGTNGREYGYLDDEANLERVIKSAENGSSLVLTIDANLQSIVEKYLAEWQNGEMGSQSAACVMMDPKTGEVLAMASTNSFDLNDPRNTGSYTDEELYQFGLEEAVGVYRRENPEAAPIEVEEVPSHFTYDEIMSYGQQVAWNKIWRNIPVSDAYEPGSTQKIFTVAGGLEEGVIKPTDSFNCEGNLQFNDGVNNWKIQCVNRNGHGYLDVMGGITQSCNVVMMRIALEEGQEMFAKYQQIFGFGDYTDIDLPAEASGLVPDPASMGRTDLATNSFGQNYTCTMIQMAAAYCSIVNGGNYYEPHVVRQVLNSDGAVVEDREPVLVRETVSQSTCNFLKEALFQTVEVGTGSAAGVEGYHIGGKTGTAEKLPRSAKNYLVSFCGFAPVEDPQVVCYVIVDQPNAVGEAQAHSSFASGIFSKIMAEALPVLNQYPEGMDASEYRAPQTVLPGNEEGDAQTVMGSQESTEAESEQPTDEDGNPIENPSSAPAASEEFIQGDSGEDLELPEPALPGLQEMESSLAESAQASSAAASIAETADEAPPETAEAAEEETGDPSAGIRPGEAQATQNIEL